MSIVALGVQKHTHGVADFVENTIPTRAIVLAFLRSAVEDAVSFQAGLFTRLNLLGALEMTTAARTFLRTVVGAARQRAIRAAVLLAHPSVTRDRPTRFGRTRLFATPQSARGLAVTPVRRTRLRASVFASDCT